MKSGRLAYQRLLVLYPSSFRREYEAELVLAFHDLARDRGRREAWIRCLTDLVRSAPRLQMEAVMQRFPIRVLAVGACIVVAGGYFAVSVGSPAVAVALLVAVIVVGFTQRQRLSRSTPGSKAQHRTSPWVLASAAAVVFLATVASWLYHIGHYDSLGNTSVLIHNAVGILSLLAMVTFSVQALQTEASPDPS